MAHEGNKGWLHKWLRLEPHQVIGDLNNPYLRRWYILPHSRLVNVYLHQFLRSDDDRALHDHPWWFASIILKGAYWEHRKNRAITVHSYRQAGNIAFRWPSTAHRVELERDRYSGNAIDFMMKTNQPLPLPPEKPVWTIVVTGPWVRRWGFYCPKGWVPWQTFDAQNGCGEN